MLLFRHPLRSSLFPYTTLFRSVCVELDADEAAEPPREGEVLGVDDVDARVRAIAEVVLGAMRVDPADVVRHRSEEHTTELQSHHELVCRLLLEKNQHLC